MLTTEQQKIGAIVLIAVVAILAYHTLCKKKGENSTSARAPSRKMPMASPAYGDPAIDGPENFLSHSGGMMNGSSVVASPSAPVVGTPAGNDGHGSPMPHSEGVILHDPEIGNTVTTVPMLLAPNPNRGYFDMVGLRPL